MRPADSYSLQLIGDKRFTMEGQGGEDGNVHDGQYANCKGYRMCEQTNKHTNIPADIHVLTMHIHTYNHA